MSAGNISKITINNEIILMRQAVRQSRVAIIRKLIKEAKLLQGRKHGDVKVQEKCKRKAQRLVAEITAVKKLKDDDITKFGITNTSKLQEVLCDMTAEPGTRIMTRIAFHKILSDRISKFKEKFPDYEQHLGPGRKKQSKIQRQANREVRNALKKSEVTGEANVALPDAPEEMENSNEDDSTNEESEASDNQDDKNIHDPMGEIETIENTEIDEDVADDLDESLAAKHGLKPGSILRIQLPSSTTKKRKMDEDSSEDSSEIETKDFVSEETEKPKKKEEKILESEASIEISSSLERATDKSKAKLKKKKKKKKNEEKKIESKASVEPKKLKSIKVVSKEASVKRFTDLLDDKETEECVEVPEITRNSKKRDVKIEKEIDSFFMTENGESEYLSVVVPKPKISEDTEEDDRFSQNHAAKRQQNFHERNNKFFSKIDQRANGSYGDKYNTNMGGRQRQNDFGKGRGPSEKFVRNSNGLSRSSRNGKLEFEKKNEQKDEDLHPSWAARKKQQEILKQGFQGKKIVFGD